MKKILAILLTIFLCASASAQIENSIVLDKSTFRAVQSDALTGVNIDPIGVDRSRRACARLKIFFHRMTREQMAQLEPVFPSGTIDYTKCKVADGNTVLILEFTARPQVKFYLKHPTFGTSNEVTFDYEGNKEYQMEASLNQTFSIVVNSNVAGADVYLDGEFKGKTDSTNSLTVKDVMIGAHNLKLQYGSVTNEQSIEVNDGSISFRLSVNTAANEPQFVVFTVEPSSAVVTIDGQHYSLTDGAMNVVLDSGTYNYTVSAAGYHSQSGTFTVSGSKVTRSISLSADAATVTLTVANNAEIWVNGVMKGTGRWSGALTSGTYIFEAKRSGHKTMTLSKHITSSQPQQNYTLPAPTPIIGSLIVSGTPINADVVLDGKTVGQMPVKLNDILVGEHKLTVSKSGYQPYSVTVTVAEGKTATVNATLTKQVAQTPSTTPQSVSNNKTSAPYKVGDYYNDGVKEGVVFEISADGCHGKIVSMKQSDLLWASDSAEQKRLIGADSETDGAYNMAKVKARRDWQSKYPAFKWCADLGEGWYLPSKEELLTIYKNKDKLNPKLTDKLSKGWYWSSTEFNKKYSGYFCAWYVLMNGGYTVDTNKGCNRCVRAVSAF